MFSLRQSSRFLSKSVNSVVRLRNVSCAMRFVLKDVSFVSTRRNVISQRTFSTDSAPPPKKSIDALIDEELNDLEGEQHDKRYELKQFLADSGFALSIVDDVARLVKENDKYRITVIFNPEYSSGEDEQEQREEDLDDLTDQNFDQVDDDVELAPNADMIDVPEQEQSLPTTFDSESFNRYNYDDAFFAFNRVFGAVVERLDGQHGDLLVGCLSGTDGNLYVHNIVSVESGEAEHVDDDGNKVPLRPDEFVQDKSVGVQLDELSSDLSDALYTWLAEIGVNDAVATFIQEYAEQEKTIDDITHLTRIKKIINE